MKPGTEGYKGVTLVPGVAEEGMVASAEVALMASVGGMFTSITVTFTSSEAEVGVSPHPERAPQEAGEEKEEEGARGASLTVTHRVNQREGRREGGKGLTVLLLPLLLLPHPVERGPVREMVPWDGDMEKRVERKAPAPPPTPPPKYAPALALQSQALALMAKVYPCPPS